jgi:hypothetical protein
MKASGLVLAASASGDASMQVTAADETTLMRVFMNASSQGRKFSNGDFRAGFR